MNIVKPNDLAITHTNSISLQLYCDAAIHLNTVLINTCAHQVERITCKSPTAYLQFLYLKYVRELFVAFYANATVEQYLWQQLLCTALKKSCLKKKVRKKAG